MFDIDLNENFRQVYHCDITANNIVVRPDIAQLITDKLNVISDSDLRVEMLNCLSLDSIVPLKNHLHSPLCV